jgi:hypothetical protein
VYLFPFLLSFLFFFFSLPFFTVIVCDPWHSPFNTQFLIIFCLPLLLPSCISTLVLSIITVVLSCFSSLFPHSHFFHYFIRLPNHFFPSFSFSLTVPLAESFLSVPFIFLIIPIYLSPLPSL